MSFLFIVNDAPYGSEKPYNALRLAMSLQRMRPHDPVRVFLMADSVTAALPNQSTPEGFYNVERMLQSIIRKGGEVKLCGTCAEARGLKQLSLIEGAEISTLNQLTEWTVKSSKVLIF